jgi:eukaryotic-like serine/threonine-protein kinase
MITAVMNLRQTVPDDVAVGDELLPGYTLLTLLRRGRRLDTFDVYSHERDCRCVVKMLRPDRSAEPEPAEALRREGHLLRDLTHPHLLRCYEVVEAPHPAIVLETLSGSMLSAVIEEQRLNAADVAQLGLQLSSALGYLHRQGWLHLDVKPANVAVAAGRATLIDLSLARRPGIGKPGAGTRGYLAPEQAAGGHLSAATDVFGLGVTLGECVSGRLAYGDEASWTAAWTRHFGRRTHRPQRRFARQLRRLPPGVAGLLLGCIEPNPTDRPTLAEVRTVLSEHADPGRHGK